MEGQKQGEAQPETPVKEEEKKSDENPNSDVNILEGKKATVTLAGKDYFWEELPRRLSRRAARCVMTIRKDMDEADLAHIVKCNAEGRPKDIADEDVFILMECADKMLDLFYEFHAGMKSDRARLDNKATEQEIQVAFGVVQQVVLLPFRR